MSKKKAIEKITAANLELKKTLAGVRSQLTKTETKLTKANEKADRWKKEAAAHRTAAARSDTRAEKLQQKLDRAEAALKPVHDTEPQDAAASSGSTAEPSTAYGLTAPDRTWTVVQLRAEAHAPRTRRNVRQNERATPRRPDLTSPCPSGTPSRLARSPSRWLCDRLHVGGEARTPDRAFGPPA